MALKNLGTNANNSITKASLYEPNGISAADLATLNAAILNDINPTHPNIAASFVSGRLFIPNRGVLVLMPGDWIGVDSTGWPILLSKRAIAAGPWTHS